LLVLPYFSGERTPINDAKAKGVIAGLSLTHTRDHLFKATLEGVALGIRHNLDTFSQIGAQIKRIVAVGGGATSEIWPQIVSDVCGKEQMLPQVTIGASYGDAFLAGCAVGLLKRNDIKDWVGERRVIQPNLNNKSLYDALYEDYLSLYRDTYRVIHKLGKQSRMSYAS
jgi:xylulokinase